MKIQISQFKIVPDALVVWAHEGPEVDVVMDLKNVTFREGTVDEIYVLHALDHLFPHEALPAMTSWVKCLKPGGEIFVVVDDFEKIARAFISGSILIDEWNEKFSHASQWTRDNLLALFKRFFEEEKVNMWLQDVPDRFPKAEYDLIFTSKKP